MRSKWLQLFSYVIRICSVFLFTVRIRYTGPATPVTAVDWCWQHSTYITFCRTKQGRLPGQYRAGGPETHPSDTQSAQWPHPAPPRPAHDQRPATTPGRAPTTAPGSQRPAGRFLVRRLGRRSAASAAGAPSVSPDTDAPPLSMCVGCGGRAAPILHTRADAAGSNMLCTGPGRQEPSFCMS